MNTHLNKDLTPCNRWKSINKEVEKLPETVNYKLISRRERARKQNS